jgi:dCTP deaminase
MLLSIEAICDQLGEDNAEDLGLRIVPRPPIEELRDKGGASIDLRLGRWFLTIRETRATHIDNDDEQKRGDRKQDEQEHDERKRAVGERSYFVPFNGEFILHPGRFVLGITLEWVRLPKGIAAYIIGKSSWGRRGLIVQAAAGVQPGFSGCLALELANIGELPIVLRPGMPICQIFLHETTEGRPASSRFDGHRKPVLGEIRKDRVLTQLLRSGP